jgi:DNA transformation protein
VTMLHVFSDRVVDMLADFGPVQQCSMFGGSGFFSRSLMFAIAVNDQLFFKADMETRPLFEARGLERFAYQQQGQTCFLGYYHAPAEVLHDGTEMTRWVQQALLSAERAHKAHAA